MLGGFRHGKGSMIWPDNSKYIGDWLYGYACGGAQFYHAEKDTYEGQYYNNKWNGFGEFKNIKDAKYIGYWKNDM